MYTLQERVSCEYSLTHVAWQRRKRGGKIVDATCQLSPRHTISHGNSRKHALDQCEKHRRQISATPMADFCAGSNGLPENLCVDCPVNLATLIPSINELSRKHSFGDKERSRSTNSCNQIRRNYFKVVHSARFGINVLTFCTNQMHYIKHINIKDNTATYFVKDKYIILGNTVCHS